jgi:hypothetical protein
MAAKFRLSGNNQLNTTPQSQKNQKQEAIFAVAFSSIKRQKENVICPT